MTNALFSQQSLKIPTARGNRADPDSAGAQSLSEFWPPDPTELERRLLKEFAHLLDRGWRGTIRSGANFRLIAIRRRRARLSLGLSSEYPDVPPRVFVSTGDTVRTELGKGQLLTLATWSSDSTLADLADEVALYMEGTW